MINGDHRRHGNFDEAQADRRHLWRRAASVWCARLTRRASPPLASAPATFPSLSNAARTCRLAVQNILTGKTFDNGTICASEQAVVVDAPRCEGRPRGVRGAGRALPVSASEADQLARSRRHAAAHAQPENRRQVGRGHRRDGGHQRAAGHALPDRGRGRRRARTPAVDGEAIADSRLLRRRRIRARRGALLRDSELRRHGPHRRDSHALARRGAHFGTEMPASRVVVNTPTTHGAIGFSTALPPSMTLGCGSWGGNVTSDNISPWHLMDIKRVAFETRPVKSKRPAHARRRNQPTPHTRRCSPRPRAPSPATHRQPRRDRTHR